MLEFEAVYVGRGWRNHSIPDELTVKMLFETTEHEFYISIVDLVRIYELVQNREEGIVDYGTGGYIELDRMNSKVADITMPPICVGFRFDDLEKAFEDLLREVFAKCDEVDGPKKREQEFPDMQRMLEKRDCDVDIRELYKRLSDPSDQ